MGCQSIAGLPPTFFAGTHLYTWMERGTLRVKCLAQEHNTTSLARTRTRTIRSGVEHTYHDPMRPPCLPPEQPVMTWYANSADINTEHLHCILIIHYHHIMLVSKIVTRPFMSSSAACLSKVSANFPSFGRIQRFFARQGITFSFGLSSGLTLKRNINCSVL